MASNVNSVGGSSSSQSSSAQTTSNDPYANLNVDTFMKLLLTELQSQDPLEPMNNAEIVQQLSQIRSIQASNELSTTLQGVALGQSVASASSLLGKMIVGLDDNAQQVAGRVDGVLIADGQAKLLVGERAVSLNNVSGFANDATGQ